MQKHLVPVNYATGTSGDVVALGLSLVSTRGGGGTREEERRRDEGTAEGGMEVALATGGKAAGVLVGVSKRRKSKAGRSRWKCGRQARLSMAQWCNWCLLPRPS